MTTPTGIRPIDLIDPLAFRDECDCGVWPPRREIDNAYASDWRNHNSIYRSASGGCPFHTKQVAACAHNAAEYERHERECKAARAAGIDDPEVIKWIIDRSRRYGDLTRSIDYLLQLLEART